MIEYLRDLVSKSKAGEKYGKFTKIFCKSIKTFHDNIQMLIAFWFNRKLWTSICG